MLRALTKAFARIYDPRPLRVRFEKSGAGWLSTALASSALFDDIEFSDDMRQFWTEIATAPEVAASARIGERVGIVELAA